MFSPDVPLALLFILVFTVVAADLVALKSKNLLVAVISYGSVGFGLSVAYMILGAPDVAIVQIVVEVVILVVLIRATIGRDEDTVVGEHEAFTSAWAWVALLLLMAMVVRIILLPETPPFGEPVMSRLTDTPSEHYLSEGLKETGAANVVAAVLLDYRGYDTLGEATVLFAAVVGAVTLLRRQARRKPGGE